MAGKQRTESTTATEQTESKNGFSERHELCSTPATTTAEEVSEIAHNVRFDLTADISYHSIREQYLARLGRLLTAVQVMLGTAAVATIAAIMPGSAMWLVFIAALAGVMLLVLDPNAAARDHRTLRNRLNGILAGLEEQPCDEYAVRKAKADLLRVRGDAPPVFRCVSAMAYNAACNALFPEAYAANFRYRVAFHRRFFANILPMRGMTFKLEIGAVEQPDGSL